MKCSRFTTSCQINEGNDCQLRLQKLTQGYFLFVQSEKKKITIFNYIHLPLLEPCDFQTTRYVICWTMSALTPC